MYIKYPVPVWLRIGLVFLLASCVFSIYLFAKVLPDYAEFKRANHAFSEHAYRTAQMKYDNLIQRYASDNSIAFNLFISAMENGDYETAVNTWNANIAEKEIDETADNKMLSYSNLLDQILEADKKLDKIYDKEYTIDEYIKAIQKLRNVNESAYLQYQIAELYSGNNDTEKALTYAKRSEELCPEHMIVRHFIVKCYRRMGQLDKAREKAKEELKRNAEDTGLIQQLAIINLLEGKNEEAYQYAKNAYTLSPVNTDNEESYYAAELLATVCHAQKKFNERDAIQKETEDAGFTFDKDYKHFVAGKIALQDIYIDKH